MNTPPLQPDDPRLVRLGSLRDRDLRREGLLVAEGRWLARRLLESSAAEAVAIVAPRFADEFAPYADRGAEILVAAEEALSQVAGFAFHRGALAVARRPALATVESVLADPRPRQTVVVLPDTTNVENLGAIFRSAAALGVDTIFLGEQCCDEFSRRTLRVSMGAALQLRLVRSGNLAADLDALRDAGFSIAATVLDSSATPLMQFCPPEKTALLFGSEADGLAEHWVHAADTQLTIPMAEGVDSLNLAAAAAIALWHVQQNSLHTDPPRLSKEPKILPNPPK